MKLVKILYFLTINIIITTCMHAQNINGIITDDINSNLVGANIIITELNEGTISNLSGEFLFKNIKAGAYTIVTSYIGYKSDTTRVNLSGESLAVNIILLPYENSINEIVVTTDRIVERTTISNISFSSEDLKTSHGLTEDPLRTLSSLPGIGRGGDLFSPSALYVRGGDPNENLFLLDNNKIYFPYYFGGQKSIFNTDVTESIELLTGGFSAQYGNHMSSVLNVTTRDGNKDDWGGMLSLGFYNSAGLIEGPIKKGKTSILIAVRRTYLDLFLKDKVEFPVPTFGDITFKLAHIINDKHKISLSGVSSDESLDYILSKPRPGIPNKLITKGNNHFQSLQLQSKLFDKIYNKLSLTNALSKSKAEIGSNLYLNIDALQMGLRNDVSIYLKNNNKIKTGIEWQGGDFNFEGTFPLDPLQTDPNDTTIVLRQEMIQDKGETQRSAYVMYDGIINSKLGLNAGLRWDYNPENNKSDFSPRLSLNYQLSKQNKIRVATGVYRQFPAGGISPSLNSEQALHYILGYEHKFSQKIYGWIEAYIKDYSNLLIYNEETEIVNSGIGVSKGIEIFLRKEKGKVNGWISYALSRSQRTTQYGNMYKDFSFDQRHIFNIVTNYHLQKLKQKEKWYLPVLIHTNFRYADGTPYTPNIGALDTGNGWVPIQGELLSKRNKDYINLNLRVEWNFKIGKKRKIKGTSFSEVWNLLNRKNILDRSYQYGDQYENNIKTTEFYTTPFLMAGGFKINF